MAHRWEKEVLECLRYNDGTDADYDDADDEISGVLRIEKLCVDINNSGDQFGKMHYSAEANK